MLTINAHPPVKVTGRHLQITDAINDYVTQKIESLHLDYPKIIEAHVDPRGGKIPPLRRGRPGLFESHHDRSLRGDR